MSSCVWVIESRFCFERDYSLSTFGGTILCFKTREIARGRIRSIKRNDESRGIKGQVIYRAVKYMSTQPQRERR